MTLSINTARTVLTISSTLLDLFVATPASYVNITVAGYVSDPDTATTETYSFSSLITASTNVRTSAGTETIVPAFFSATTFSEGVYKFVVTLTSEANVQTDEGCVFIHEDLKCTVDTNLLDETVPILERVLNGLKYQSLINTDECPCKCDEKMELYNNLILINEGCKTC